MISCGCFEIAAPTYLENCQKNVCDGVSFRVARIKSTAFYRTALQIHSGSAQKGKYILKFQNFQKTLCKTVNATKYEFLTKFLEGAFMFTEHFQEVISNGVPYQKFTDL